MKIDIRGNTNYIWKIVFTFFIAYIHSTYFKGETRGWYLCVDFFFFSSGFVLTKAKETDTFMYIWRRTRKLWPHLFMSYMMIYIYVYRNNFEEMIRQMLIHIGESTPFSYFFFNFDFAGKYPLNYPTWYVTCLLICSMVIHYLYFNNRRLYVSVIAPVAIILIYGYIYRSASSLNTGREVGVFLNEYLLRAFAGLSVGVLGGYILNRIQEVKFSRFFFAVVRIIEMTMMSLFIWGG